MFPTAPLSRRRLLAGAAALAALPSAGRAEGAGRIRCAFADQSFEAVLNDSPTAHDLMSLLPLELSIEDYSNNEKIAYPPRKLVAEDPGGIENPQPGDVCYYAPWGDVVFFYAAYRYSRGLIRIGRIDGPVDPLLVKGEYPLRIEAIG